MSRLPREEIEDQLDMEYFLDRESVAFNHTRGVSGAQLNIRLCPICGDTRWRVYFGLDSGFGNCFVCSQGFSKMKFVHYALGHGDEHWGQTFRECREILREQGWQPKRQAVAAIDHGDIRLPISEALPLETGEILDYLTQRGFDATICRYFGLRWCQFGFWMFKDQEGKTQTQTFSNRVIIPVYDLDGKLVTFQGRDLTGTSLKKYLFPMELPGTGRYLLNGQNVLATDHVVMGEGAFDVAAIKMAFDEDNQLRTVVPVGSFGKHLSYGSPTGDDQLGRFHQLKQRGLKIITIMWDGESNALIAALNAGKLLSGVGFRVRVALLPPGKDPNEITGEEVRQAHYAAQLWTPMMDVKLRLRNPYARP